MFSQRDSQWANIRLGTVDGTTIGQFGCYVSVLAEIARHFHKIVDPETLDDYFTRNGLYIDGNLCYPGILSKAYSDIPYIERWDFYDVPARLDMLVNSFEDEYAIEVDFDHNPSNGTQTHFLRFVSYNNGILIVGDPWYGDEIVFTDRYGDPATTIQQIVHYRGPLPTPAPQPDPAPTPPAPEAPAPVNAPEPAPLPEPVPAPVPPAVPEQTTGNYQVVVKNDSRDTLHQRVGWYLLLRDAYHVFQSQDPALDPRILTSSEQDLTADTVNAMKIPVPSVPGTPSLRLPALDSATFKAIITFIQVNVPIALVWVTDPQVITFVTTYIPWLLPLLSFGAAAAAFIIGVARKDVKNY